MHPISDGRTCTKCGVSGGRDMFKPSKAYTNGLASWCRKCSNQYVKQWQTDNPEKRNLSELRAGLKKRYGMTVERYLELYTRQDGKCAICRTSVASQVDVATQLARSEKNKNTTAHVDHCHKTSTVRGLLCSKCNTGIGQLQESVEILESAIRYITDAQKIKAPGADK